MAGDVSARRYFRARLRDGGSVICAAYPADMRDVQRRFETSARLLREAGVRVPRTLASFPGLTVLEDFGDRSLHRPGQAVQAEWLLKAASLAQRISKIDRDEVARLNPPLDEELFRRELDQTWTVALLPAGIARDSHSGRLLSDCLESVCAALGRLERVPCHRDFMVRNLVELESGEVGVLDHQDLRLGPRGYDFASLASDSAVCSDSLRRRLQRMSGASPEDFERLTAQRMLKIVGTFHAFALRGSSRHLALVPPSIEAATAALARLPEAAPWIAGGGAQELLRCVSAATGEP